MNNGGDVLFVLMGAVMVLAMHAGFAFLEVGTVRKKNQVNALVKIIADFAVSTLAYFFVGYGVAYGTSFFTGDHAIADKNGYEHVKIFFLLTIADAIPASSRAAAPSARGFIRSSPPLHYWWAWSFRFSKALPVTATSVCKLGLRRTSAPSFTTLRVRWLCTPWVAGSRWSPSCCWARGTAGTRKTVRSPRIRHPASPFSRSARGYLPWAGSGST